MKKFMMTSDRRTAEMLIANGFKLVSQIGNTYTFVNQMTNNLSFDDKSNIVYTNMLSL